MTYIHLIIRHAHHVPALRQAAICALDLGNNPSAVDEKILYVEVKLKIEHQDLPVSQKYEPVNGLVFTFAEAAVMLGECPQWGTAVGNLPMLQDQAQRVYWNRPSPRAST